jgi:hypothetical protein
MSTRACSRQLSFAVKAHGLIRLKVQTSFTVWSSIEWSSSDVEAGRRQATEWAIRLSESHRKANFALTKARQKLTTWCHSIDE